MIRIEYYTLTIIQFLATIPYVLLASYLFLYPAAFVHAVVRSRPEPSQLYVQNCAKQDAATPYFQQLTNAYFHNLFKFTLLQTGGGVFLPQSSSLPLFFHGRTICVQHTNPRNCLPFLRLLHSSLYAPRGGYLPIVTSSEGHSHACKGRRRLQRSAFPSLRAMDPAPNRGTLLVTRRVSSRAFR